MIDLIGPGDPRRAKIDALQLEIARLDAEIAGTRAAPLPLEDVRENTRRWLAGLVTAVRPAALLAALTRPGGHTPRLREAPTEDVQARVAAVAAGATLGELAQRVEAIEARRS